MLIVALQDDIDNLYAIWNTVTDRFLGVNLTRDWAMDAIIQYKHCSIAEANSRLDNPQPFSDIGSNRPERSNLYSAYSDKITGGFYDGTLEMVNDPTYTYKDIYPKIVEKKAITDGKDLTIDFLRKKTYPTFTMRSIYGTLNGACDCDGLGVYDDLFSGIDEALSEDRQATVWGKFDNNFMPRIKPGKAKLLGIGTRWAPKDVQGRRLELLANNPEYKNIRHREVIIPALNENNESNFDYPYKLGYSTLDYKRRMASFEDNDDIRNVP